MKLIIALIMLLSSIMLIISSNVDKEIAELDRLISLQKNKLAQLKQQKDSSNSNSKRVVDSKSSVEVNNNINEPLTVLDNVFTNKFKYHVDYNIIDARILVTKLRPRRINRKGHSSMAQSKVVPVLENVQLFSLIDTNGTLHIINDVGLELDTMHLEHTSTITAITYDGFDASSPVLITGDSSGNVHITYLQVYRFGSLVAGNQKFIALLPPASTAIDISVMSIINTKFKLPPFEKTNDQCDNNSKTCSKDSKSIVPYPTSLCSFYKATAKFHVIYTGDSMGRLFQHKSNGDRLRLNTITNGTALSVCSRQGTTLAFSSGRSIFMVNAGKLSISQRVCQTPSDVVGIDYDTSKSSNQLYVKLITGESMIIQPRSLSSRPVNSTRCPIYKRFSFDNNHIQNLNTLYNKTMGDSNPSALLQYTSDMLIGSHTVTKHRIITTVGCNIVLFNVTNRRTDNVTSIKYTAPNCNEDIPKSLSSFYNKNKKMTGFKNIRVDSTTMLPRPQGFMKLPPPNPLLFILLAYNNDRKSKSKATLIVYRTVTRNGLVEVDDPLSSMRSYYPFLQHFAIFILIAIIFYYRNSKSTKNSKYNQSSKFTKGKGGTFPNRDVEEILKTINKDTKSKIDDLGSKRLSRLMAEVEKLSAEVDNSKNKK